MASLTPELVDLITQKVGRFNTDVLTGWETGLRGKRLIGGKFYEQTAPEHLQGKRYFDWLAGKEAACRHRESLHRTTHFVGTGSSGEMRVVRKGWVARRKVVTQMERGGAAGDITVFYFENGELKRTVMCMI